MQDFSDFTPKSVYTVYGMFVSLSWTTESGVRMVAQSIFLGFIVICRILILLNKSSYKRRVECQEAPCLSRTLSVNNPK